MVSPDTKPGRRPLIPLGIPRDAWTNHCEDALERLGFDGDRVTVFMGVRSSKTPGAYEPLNVLQKGIPPFKVGEYIFSWSLNVRAPEDNRNAMKGWALDYAGHEDIGVLDVQREFVIDAYRLGAGVIVQASAVRLLDVMPEETWNPWIELYKRMDLDQKKLIGQAKSIMDLRYIFEESPARLRMPPKS